MELSTFTKQMQDMMPQWMKMAKDPNSVGAQFLNVFGLEFDDVEYYLNQVINNSFIETADVDQIDIIYKVPLVLPVVIDLVDVDEVYGITSDGDKIPFFISVGLRQFYQNNGMNEAIFDRTEGVVYLKPNNYLMNQNLLHPFDAVEINGTTHYEYSLHHVWNPFDEFGMLLGLQRLFGERNSAFKERILDIFRKPANSTKNGLINGISRDLGIDENQVAINELSNKAFKGSLLNDDGTPTQKLVNYVDKINKTLGFTWDNMSWGEAYWHSLEENQMGFDYLPHIWDATVDPWKDVEFQSGIGDNDDLLVTAPKDESNTRNFTYYVGLRGYIENLEEIDPEIRFKYKITAHGKVLNEDYKPETYRYTVVAAEIIKLHFIIRAHLDFVRHINLNFDTANQAGYIYDSPGSPNVEIVTGNTIMSDPVKTHLKVTMDISTSNRKVTPSIHDLTIRYHDQDDIAHDFTLTTQDDFTRADAGVTVSIDDLDVTTDGNVELGFGDFYYMIDTEGSWKEGSTQDGSVRVLREGTLELNLPPL